MIRVFVHRDLTRGPKDITHVYRTKKTGSALAAFIFRVNKLLTGVGLQSEPSGNDVYSLNPLRGGNAGRTGSRMCDA